MMYCFSTGLHTKAPKTTLQLLFCCLAYKQMILGYFRNFRLSLFPGERRDSKMGLLVQTTTFSPLLLCANEVDEN